MTDHPSHEDPSRQILLTAAQGIAEHLDGDWSLGPQGSWKNLVELEGPDGKGIQIYWPFGSKTAEICGVFPKLPCGEWAVLRREDRDRCCIGATLTRPATQLANGISRRLLPSYEEIFERVGRQVHHAELRERAASKVLQDLASLCRVDSQSRREAREHEVRLSNYRGLIRASCGDSSKPAKAELHLLLSPEVAREVLELVTARCPELAARR